LAAAQERLLGDRIEAINPVMVDSFLRQVCAAEGWTVTGRGLLRISARGKLPAELGGGRDRYVCADEDARRAAWQDGVLSARDALVLGPADEAFARLVATAVHDCEPELRRGAHAQDAGSLTDYTLIAFDGHVETHDGIRVRRLPLPILVRFSGGEAFPVAWESVMSLEVGGAQGARPGPAARLECKRAAERAAAEERAQRLAQVTTWTAAAERKIDAVEQQLRRQLRDQPVELRATQRARFDRDKRERLFRLARMAQVSVNEPLPIGWIQVTGTGSLPEMGTDPDSEKVAIARVWGELDAHGYEVDDRQSARLGYDLFARHRSTRQIRLVEVKGQQGDLAPVTLERHEWEQAQQRGDLYWLYLVTNCATDPRVFARIRDPADVFGGVRTIQRHQISIRQLREAVDR
jgi:hypothetical protein